MILARCLSIILILGSIQTANAVTDANSAAKAAEKLYSIFLTAKMDTGGHSTTEMAKFFDHLVVPGQNDESAEILASYSMETKAAPSKHPFVIKLASLITAPAQSDTEKLLLIHNFVLWRMTHAAIFIPKYATPVALVTRKGKLAQCINESADHGVSTAWVKPPVECGLVEDIDVGDNWVLALFFTGLHNCSGYASLFATLARATGFPTQIVQSTQVGTLHIWNRVYYKGAWRNIDTTFDDAYDRGQYEDNSTMTTMMLYFLRSDEGIAKQDPESHAAYTVTND